MVISIQLWGGQMLQFSVRSRYDSSGVFWGTRYNNFYAFFHSCKFYFLLTVSATKTMNRILCSFLRDQMYQWGNNTNTQEASFLLSLFPLL